MVRPTRKSAEEHTMTLLSVNFKKQKSANRCLWDCLVIFLNLAHLDSCVRAGSDEEISRCCLGCFLAL